MAVNPAKYRDEIAARYPVSRNGAVVSTSKNFPGKELSWSADKDGYPIVFLYLGGRCRQVHVHRLVALFHLPPRPSPRHEIRHLDGDRWNPDADNLVWGTPKENAEDREAHGRTARGEAQGQAKLTGDTALEIRALRKSGATQQKIAGIYGVSQSTVWRTINHVTSF